LAGLSLEGTETFRVADQLTQSQQRALYRILQESLTNALRHGDVDSPVRLSCTIAHDLLTISISNRIRQSESPVRVGHGLIGMSERASLASGEFHYVQESGNFVVMIQFAVHPVLKVDVDE